MSDQWEPRNLEDIPIAEKIRAFDEIYVLTYDLFKSARRYFPLDKARRYFPLDNKKYLEPHGAYLWSQNLWEKGTLNLFKINILKKVLNLLGPKALEEYYDMQKYKGKY